MLLLACFVIVCFGMHALVANLMAQRIDQGTTGFETFQHSSRRWFLPHTQQLKFPVGSNLQDF